MQQCSAASCAIVCTRGVNGAAVLPQPKIVVQHAGPKHRYTSTSTYCSYAVEVELADFTSGLELLGAKVPCFEQGLWPAGTPQIPMLRGSYIKD